VFHATYVMPSISRVVSNIPDSVTVAQLTSPPVLHPYREG
jgi:hypothetical protein